jgi:hypothetical protein
VFGPRPPLTASAASRLATDAEARAAILVEGWSDQAAVETLARRRDCDLRAEGIVVVPIGGVTNLGHFVDALGARGLGIALAGLYDAGEERHVLRSLERCGLGSNLTRASAQALGFFVCTTDLEDELIRALGTAAVEQVIESEGELGSLRRFQAQPFQQTQDHRAQLRRFMGTRAGRKIRYGALLAGALTQGRVPRALDLVLARAGAVFRTDQHLWSRAFAPMAALQILAMPLGIAVVCALPRGRIRWPISAAQCETLH